MRKTGLGMINCDDPRHSEKMMPCPVGSSCHSTGAESTAGGGGGGDPCPLLELHLGPVNMLALPWVGAAPHLEGGMQSLDPDQGLGMGPRDETGGWAVVRGRVGGSPAAVLLGHLSQ